MRRINQCLNAQLGSLCQKAIQLDILQSKVISLLPEDMQPHCQVASFNHGSLVLTATDAAWASQIRFVVPELRDKLRKRGFYQLSSIKITIKEQPAYEAQTRHYSTSLSTQARATILNESEHCRYEPLKVALKKLAGTYRKK